jgi:YHS domain-containing protein
MVIVIVDFPTRRRLGKLPIGVLAPEPMKINDKMRAFARRAARNGSYRMTASQGGVMAYYFSTRLQAERFVENISKYFKHVIIRQRSISHMF